MMTQKILNRDPKDEILKAFRLFDDDETGINTKILHDLCILPFVFLCFEMVQV